MKNKALLIGIVATIGVAGFLIWRQFKKLMDYKLSFRSVKVNKINAKELSLTLGLNFQNKSDIQLVLTKQKYDVFINSVLLSTITNDKEVVVAPKSTTPMTFSVSVGSKGIADLLKTMNFQELLNIKKQKLKVASTIDVKVGSKVRTITQTSEDIIENWTKAE
jgi:LEA14-like dessication related protein